jgi:hypothetical protein
MYLSNNPLGFYKPHPETRLQKSFNRSRVRAEKITNSISQGINRMPEISIIKKYIQMETIYK